MYLPSCSMILSPNMITCGRYVASTHDSRSARLTMLCGRGSTMLSKRSGNMRRRKPWVRISLRLTQVFSLTCHGGVMHRIFEITSHHDIEPVVGGMLARARLTLSVSAHSYSRDTIVTTSRSVRGSGPSVQCLSIRGTAYVPISLGDHPVGCRAAVGDHGAV